MDILPIVLPARLFSVPIFLPYVQPALTREAIDAAEAALGVTLPAAYLATLRLQNGGSLHRSVHPSGLAGVPYLAGVGPRFPHLGRDWAETKAYMRENEIVSPVRIDELVTFSGDGDFYWCLDYRERGRRHEPRVTYIDVEVFDVDVPIAPDFLSFLHQLRSPPPVPVLGVFTQQPFDEVAAAVSAASGLPFDWSTDHEEHYGYRAAFFRGAGVRAWMTPNRVRRGFVPRRDREHAGLRGLMPEVVDRDPALAACGYFLASDFETDAGRAFVQALAGLPYPTRIVAPDL